MITRNCLPSSGGSLNRQGPEYDGDHNARRDDMGLLILIIWALLDPPPSPRENFLNRLLSTHLKNIEEKLEVQSK